MQDAEPRHDVRKPCCLSLRERASTRAAKGDKGGRISRCWILRSSVFGCVGRSFRAVLPAFRDGPEGPSYKKTGSHTQKRKSRIWAVCLAVAGVWTPAARGNDNLAIAAALESINTRDLL